MGCLLWGRTESDTTEATQQQQQQQQQQQAHREKYTELSKADLTARAREDSVIIFKANQVTFFGVLDSTFHMSALWN